MTTYAELAAQKTQAEWASDLLVRIEARGITSKGWTDTDVRRALVEVNGDIKESEDLRRVDFLNSGFLDKAEGPLLDLLGVGFFDEERFQATSATIRLTARDTVGQGPYTLAAGSIAVIAADTATPLYYRLIATTVAPLNGEALCDWAAVGPGSAYNALSGVPVKLSTPVPGVELAATFQTSLSGVVVFAGVDEESDTSFRGRLRDKWATIAAGWTAGAVRFWIRKILPQATRILVRDDNPATGEVWAYCATPTGPISAADAAAAEAYLNSAERKPVGNKPVRVMPAVSLLVSRTITLFTDGSPDAVALAAGRLSAAALDYPLGTRFPVSRMIDALYDPTTGVYSAAVAPNTDIVPAPNEAISLALTYVEELFS